MSNEEIKEFIEQNTDLKISKNVAISYELLYMLLQMFRKEINKSCNLQNVTIPVKIINPINIVWFDNIVKLNEWYGDGELCEIIAMNYDSEEGVHYVHYRLK